MCRRARACLACLILFFPLEENPGLRCVVAVGGYIFGSLILFVTLTFGSSVLTRRCPRRWISLRRGGRAGRRLATYMMGWAAKEDALGR
ncbi:hypothetical protein IWZ03DRAFT_47429 [Phyllosticta citriasiana]|uniref:Uncharacterized protein n=1 Tax=Phyllosticta citriasiana TaxID=595635 RepID=A0ABR1KJU1_9PEZI